MARTVLTCAHNEARAYPNGVALVRLMELLFEYLTTERSLDPAQTAAVLWRDYQRGGRRDRPAFLKDFLPPETPRPAPARTRLRAPKRQARHWV